MQLIILILVAFLASPSASFAATLNAASCSEPDIMAQVDAAADNDIVSVPAGTCTYAELTTTNIVNQGGLCKFTSASHGLVTGSWVTVAVASGVGGCGAASAGTPHRVTVVDDNTFTVADSAFSGSYSSGGNVRPRIVLYNKSVAVIGGSGGTTTLDGTPYIHISSTGGSKTLRFSGFTISYPASSEGAPFRVSTDNTSLFRIDNNVVSLGDGSFGGYSYGSYGVIDNNYFTGNTQKWEVYGKNGISATTNEWYSATDLGTNKFVIFENNTFYNTNTSKAWAGVNCQYGGRYVARYNNFINQDALSHGAMGVSTAYEGRACRVKEVYENTFTCEAGHTCYAWVESFGGRDLIYNNVSVGGWQLGFNFMVQRVSDADAKGSPWLACTDNTHAWDGNTNPAGYPCHDQAGVGPDTGDPNTTPQTITEPSYFWGNTGSKTNIWAQSAHLQLDREYCTHDTSTACGGITTAYTPYTYPHPLTRQAGTTLASPSFRGSSMSGGWR